MKNKLINKRGMSLLEMVVVIAIIIAMTTVSIPLFLWLKDRSQERNLNQLVKKIQSGIAAKHYQELIHHNLDQYPFLLDTNPQDSYCITCFENVLPKGIDNPQWHKIGPTTYYFILERNRKKYSPYDQKGNFKLTYNNQNGEVLLTAVEKN